MSELNANMSEYVVVKITPHETVAKFFGSDIDAACQEYLYSPMRDIDLGYRTMMCRVTLDTMRECEHHPHGFYLNQEGGSEDGEED
jgi:hypothetical protein